MNNRITNVGFFPHENELRFESHVPSRMDKVNAFFQKQPFDTVKLSQGGKPQYLHFIGDDVKSFDSKRALRKALSQESGGAWVEEKEGKKRYFVDESGWFHTSYKQVSKEEYLQRLEAPSTMQKVLGIGLGILALLPGASEIKERLPFDASEAGMSLLAMQQKNPLLGALGCSLLPSSVEAQAVGLEFQVNTNTARIQAFPAIAPSNEGGFVVTWSSNGQDGDSYGIFAQRYSAIGTLLGTEFQVNTYTTGSQNHSAVASLNDGGFVVAWASYDQDGDSYGIFAQRYDTSGALFGSEFQVNNYTTGGQSDPAIAPLNDGGFVVIWSSDGQDGDSYGIFAQRYDTSGALLDSEFQVNTYTTRFQVNPEIAPLNNGGFVVAWASYDQDGDGDGIFAQRYDTSGALFGSEFQVSNYSIGNPQYPAIAPLNDGGFVVTWAIYGQDGDGYSIFAQRYDASGDLLGSEFQVNTYTADDQQFPVIAPLNDGGFVVAWSSDEQDGYFSGIFGQRYDRNGNAIPLSYVSSDIRNNPTSIQQTSLVSRILSITNLVYSQSYPIYVDGVVVGTFSLSGGTGVLIIESSNALTLELDYEPEDGNTITLFTVPEDFEGNLENIEFNNADDDCTTARGEIVEGAEGEQEYHVIFEKEPCESSATKMLAITAPVIFN